MGDTVSNQSKIAHIKASEIVAEPLPNAIFYHQPQFYNEIQIEKSFELGVLPTQVTKI